jgi:serine carboxypeptidase 1
LFQDFYNFLLDYVNDPVIGSTTQESKGFVAADRYSRYLSTKMYPSPGSTGVRSTENLYDLMNGPIRQKLKIIPENVA